jgi:hypothetical protein
MTQRVNRVTGRLAAKFAGKLTHDSPTRAPCPIGVGVGFVRVRFPPDPAPHRTLSSGIQDREDQNSRSLVRGPASKQTASAHDRMWIHFRFTVLTEVVAQPDFSISAFAAGIRTIRFLGLESDSPLGCVDRPLPSEGKVTRSNRVGRATSHRARCGSRGGPFLRAVARSGRLTDAMRTRTSSPFALLQP